MRIFRIFAVFVCVAGVRGQSPQGGAAPTPTPSVVEQDADSLLLNKQTEAKISQRILETARRSNVSIVISLGTQRAYLLVNGEQAIDSPCCTARRSGATPVGDFKIIEKALEVESLLYGDFVNRKTQQVVQTGVHPKVASAPSGTVFRGTTIRCVLRLSTPMPVSIFAGKLLGYPDTGGSIRLPEGIAEKFFLFCGPDTLVKIQE